MSRVSDHIMRVEVHLNDENSVKDSQNGMRCMTETCLEGRQRDAVAHQAATLDEAIEGTVGKLTRLCLG